MAIVVLNLCFFMRFSTAIATFWQNQTVGTRKKQKAPSFFMKAVFAYLCIFRAFFRAILKVH